MDVGVTWCGWAVGKSSSSSERQEYRFWSVVGRLEEADGGWWILLVDLGTEDWLVAYRVLVIVLNKAHGCSRVGADLVTEDCWM